MWVGIAATSKHCSCRYFCLPREQWPPRWIAHEHSWEFVSFWWGGKECRCCHVRKLFLFCSSRDDERSWWHNGIQIICVCRCVCLSLLVDYELCVFVWSHSTMEIYCEKKYVEKVEGDSGFRVTLHRGNIAIAVHIGKNFVTERSFSKMRAMVIS